MNEKKSVESQTIRAGSITYFLDIKETKANKPYLMITESQFRGEGVERRRRTISVFQEHIPEFIAVLNTISKHIPSDE